jgi:hypothetical protein
VKATPEAIVTASAGPRLALVVSSHARLTGRSLPAAAELWSAPCAVVAHGLEDDPVFFYGNRLALELFEADAGAFTRMPSRLSAEPMLQAERAELLARVSAMGFIDDYSGVRVSATGRRFRIKRAVVWNLVDEGGAVHGQAAAFDRWTRLD